MAPEIVQTLSFDEIIQRDREERDRKNYQSLANEIFRKGKKAKSQSNGNRKIPTGPSLASRVGITKASQRSTSNTSRSNKAQESFASENLPCNDAQSSKTARTSRPASTTERLNDDRISEALTAKGAMNQSRPRSTAPEISIRGAAGPYTVVASNFAPGTTAADIESAMVPSGSAVLGCKIIVASPTVIAEIVFGDKRNAEGVIETFNNKKADGRILHVYMKQGAPTAGVIVEQNESKQDVLPANSSNEQSDARLSSNDHTEKLDDRDRRKPDTTFQDGRYGFADQEDQMQVDAEQPAVDERGSERGSERRDAYQNDHYRRRDERHNYTSGDYGTTRYYDRGWGGPRRSYADSRYSRYPTRGYR